MTWMRLTRVDSYITCMGWPPQRLHVILYDLHVLPIPGSSGGASSPCSSFMKWTNVRPNDSP